MTYKCQLMSVLTAMLVCACSSLEERELASGDFGYLNEEPGQTIKIPEGVDQPKFSDAYKLPDLGEDAPRTTMGKDLSVMSPSLVLPIVAGSRLKDGSKEATVWFDQVDDDKPLEQTIWNTVTRFLEKQGVGVELFDKEKQRLVTDWIVIDESTETKWYSFSGSERTIAQRFEFSLNQKNHGRSAALSADLVDYKEQLSADSDIITKAQDDRRNEVDILNQIVQNYQFETQVANVKRFRKIRQGLDMELGFDGDGEPAFVVDADYDIAWPRLLLVLRKLGFDVKDYDKSNGLMFVKYGGGESGWWDSLWSNDKNDLALDTDEYRVKVVSVGEKTSVTLMDDESAPFPVNKLTDLYPTFSETMSADDLDI